MKAFQPILTCFLCLFIVNIAVRGMAVINKRRFVCSNQATTSKLYMKELFKKWDKEKPKSARININLSQIKVNRAKLNRTTQYLWNKSTANPQCSNNANCLNSTMYKLWFWSDRLRFSLYCSSVSQNVVCRMPWSVNSYFNLEIADLQAFLMNLDNIFVGHPPTIQDVSVECQENDNSSVFGVEDICTVFDKRFLNAGTMFIDSLC